MSSYNNDQEEIKSRLDIVDVISEYVSLKKAGQNWKGLCPFHAEKTPSFMVSPSKQIYHCFGCGSGGDIFTFLIKNENLSFQEALRVLAKKAGVSLQRTRVQTAAVGLKQSLLDLHKDAALFYQQNLKPNTKPLNYLKGRGITAEIQKRFSIGYAPDTWDALLSYLKKKGYKADLIEKAGLVTKGKKGFYDTFRNRIIFPIFDMRGEVIAFGGRVMSESTRSGDKAMPKYLNSPETPIFSKSRVLYGLDLAKETIKKTGFVIFVEGYLDVITSHMYGFANAVAPLGTALTPEHGKLIKRFTQDAVIVFDGDASGIKAAKSGISVLLECDLNVKVLSMPLGEDPDSLLKKQGKEAFDALIRKEQSIVDFFVFAGGGSQQEGGARLIAREALEIISRIPDSVLQGSYTKLLAERLGINELFIREELGKVKKRLRTRRPQRPDAASVKESPRVSGARASARPRDEMYILQLVLQFPEMAESIFSTVSADDLDDSVARSIFKKMEAGLISSNDLISECSEEEKNLLTALSLKTEFAFDTESGDPEKLLADCVKRIRFRKRQALLNGLQDKIKKAESEKDHHLLKTLQREHQKLLRLKG
ncbi:DNA primase [bacterium BMS3Abin10]|nr:DNA primase [bacterium BMS3Abin10]GBE37707.1 DNA primase [bacterium BMS3Bbin08]